MPVQGTVINGLFGGEIAGELVGGRDCHGSSHQTLQELAHMPGTLSPGRVHLCTSVCRQAHAPQAVTVVLQCRDMLRQGGGIPRSNEKAVLCLSDQLMCCTSTRSDDRQPKPHGFQVGDAERLIERWDSQHLMLRQMCGYLGVGTRTEQPDPVMPCKCIDLPADAVDIVRV